MGEVDPKVTYEVVPYRYDRPGLLTRIRWSLGLTRYNPDDNPIQLREEIYGLLGKNQELKAQL